jgi:endo-1,4-beta-mannosidase
MSFCRRSFLPAIAAFSTFFAALSGPLEAQPASSAARPPIPNDSHHREKPGARWTAEKALQWSERTGYLLGANFSPSTASNQLEMWQGETFDTATIARELGYARDIGLNSVRVYLHDIPWRQDSTGFLRRVDTFLSIAQRNGIRVILVLLDGVWDPYPKPGPQEAPIPHVHNSRWVQSPGAVILGDTARHVEVRTYVQSVLRRFGADSRVIVWDLFNEPDND